MFSNTTENSERYVLYWERHDSLFTFFCSIVIMKQKPCRHIWMVVISNNQRLGTKQQFIHTILKIKLNLNITSKPWPSAYENINPLTIKLIKLTQSWLVFCGRLFFSIWWITNNNKNEQTKMKEMCLKGKCKRDCKGLERNGNKNRYQKHLNLTFISAFNVRSRSTWAPWVFKAHPPD